MDYELIQSPILAKEHEAEARITVSVAEIYEKNIGTLWRFRTPPVFINNRRRPEVIIPSETDLGYRISFYYYVTYAFFFCAKSSDSEFMGCEPVIRLFDAFIQMLQHIYHLYDCLLRNHIVRNIADGKERVCVFYRNQGIIGGVFAAEVEGGIVSVFQEGYDFGQLKVFIIIGHSNHSFSETCFYGQSEDVRFDRTQSPILAKEFHGE